MFRTTRPTATLSALRTASRTSPRAAQTTSASVQFLADHRLMHVHRIVRTAEQLAVNKSLILEVLNAHPSLRDSKSYLKSFAPRPNTAHQQLPPHLRTGAHLPPTFATPQPPPAPRPRSEDDAHAAHIPLPPHHHLDSLGSGTPSTSAAAVSQTRTSGTRLETTEIAPDGAADLAQPLDSSPIQQHTALVKIQGPFTERQLSSIADGMVYLKKLGLMSIIVLDNEAWHSSVAHFSPETGHLLEGSDDGLEQWMGTGTRSATAEGKQRVDKSLSGLRRRMLQETYRFADLLGKRGAAALPFPRGIMRVDAKQAKAVSEMSRPWATPRAPDTTASPHPLRRHNPPLTASRERSPLISDDALSSVRAALAADQIPVLPPFALFDDPDSGGGERTIPVSADDLLVGLARDMAMVARADEEKVASGSADVDVDMMPLRLLVINREGGIPSHARGGNPHLAINLASEMAQIQQSFIWNDSHPTALESLRMVSDCLSYMPHTSSGVVVSHRSPRSLIANLITNKAAHSPSLPASLLANKRDVRHTPTIIRPGLGVRVLSRLEDVDLPKLTTLLEESFQRTLDTEGYYGRLAKNLDFVIVAGDYQGAAIVTRESLPDDEANGLEPIAYLDKFAVLPELQGSGTVDFLWGALRDEVQGLGLLDALNDNGGLGGFGKGRDLVWKSRADNPVNRWYYERSNGFVRIHTAPPAGASMTRAPAWSLFWCDAEERIASMAGETRLSASASQDDVLEHAQSREFEREAQYEADTAAAARARRASLNEPEEDDWDDGSGQGHRAAARSGRGKSEAMPDLTPLTPLSRAAGQRLLPVVADEEVGRLKRWERAMNHIPSAWL